MIYINDDRYHGHTEVFNKDTPFRTFLHYSECDPDKNNDRTVWGAKRPGLFYNYSDRLYGQKWDEGVEKAQEQKIKPDTARWFETILNHFHGTDTVDLQHVILGCNMSNGYHYLIFGYTYQEQEKS